MIVVACGSCGTKNRVDPRNAADQVAQCGKCRAPLDLNRTVAAAAEDSKPVIVTDGNFNSTVLQSGSKPVLLDCWAPWCGPCRMIGPIMEQLALESKGRYLIAKLNVDENDRTAAQFQIQSIPTMLIFKNGDLVDRLVGAQPKAAIAERLMAHVGE